MITRYADDYYGETVTGYALLERAGVICGPGAPVRQEAAELPRARDQSQVLSRALAYVPALKAMLVETQSEFERLPIFARPMARSGFSRKSGLRIQDWQGMVNQLDETLRKAQTAGRLGATNGQPLVQQLAETLPRLADYYAGVPAEVARFTRDEPTLDSVMRITQAHLQALADLSGALAALYA